MLQSRVNAIYDMFCGDVAANMGLDLASREKWADGRDFLAAEAMQLGLVTGLVADRDEVITKLLQESHMDKTELAQKHPDLLASIQSEAVQGVIEEYADKFEAARDNAIENTLAIMETVCGKEQADKVREVIKAGVNAVQFKAVANIIGSSEKTGASKQAQMLQAIKEATPGHVAASNGAMDNVQAFIERMAQI